MNIFLIIGLIISVILNMYLYFQLKRYQVNDNTYKAKWQEVMGLNNPLNIILWIILILSILIGVPVTLSIFFNGVL
jgi:heme/copper-type cytochrome/quinol oxidase subunit 2